MLVTLVCAPPLADMRKYSTDLVSVNVNSTHVSLSMYQRNCCCMQRTNRCHVTNVKNCCLAFFFCLWQCFRFYFYYFFFCIYSPRSPCQLTIYITAACRWNCHRLRGDKIDMQNYKICGKVEGKGEKIRKTVQKIGKCNGNMAWIILEELNDDIESAARWNDWKSPPIVIHCW